MRHFFIAFLLLSQAAGAGSDKLPDGEILYYQEERRGQGNLVVLDLATGDKRQIGRSGSRPDHFASWSADGRKIAFESYRRGGWHVWVCDADGGNARRLSNLPSRNYEFDPSFAPDSRTAIFLRPEDLWTVTLDDPTPKRITPEDNGLFETAPKFSPDGRKIAFMGQDSRGRNVYTMNADGGGLKNLTENQGNNLAPVWSPDGGSILFYSDRNGSLELHEMTSRGTNPRPIFSLAQLSAAGFGKTALIDPWDNDWGATEQYRADYSPDGRWIVFSREIGGDRELFVARRDGNEITRITNRPGLDGMPSWRPR